MTLANSFHICRIALQLNELGLIRDDARAEGFQFIERLFRDWETGQNRFADEGEMLVGAFNGEKAIAICGINRDPYLDDRKVGRLRHLYVLREHRRRGIAYTLVVHLLKEAKKAFERVRVRTDNSEADKLYLKCAFLRSDSPTATHEQIF